MEVQQLRHLLAAVQYGNLVKASEECYISQSGLSRSIKSLETRLGVPLLIRSSSGVTPTVYGSTILERARVIMNEVSRSVQEIKEVRAGRTGLVSIGVTHNFAHNLLPGIVSEYATGKSSIRTRIFAASFPAIVDMVKTGEVDFGFGLLGVVENVAGLTVEEICGSHARVVARRSHPLGSKARVSLANLSAANWAMLDSESLQTKFAAFFQSRGKAAPVQVLKTNSVVLLKRVLLQMDALTVLPIDMVRTELESGELTVIDAEPPSEYARAGLIFRENTYISPAMQCLIDEIRKRASDINEDEFMYSPSEEKAAKLEASLVVAAE